MIIESTNLPGVMKITPNVFEDERGRYVETYNKARYESMGVVQDFVQDDISTSSRNVLRGIHGDFLTTKLISCSYGAFYLVVVENRYQKGLHRWEAFEVSAENRLQVLVPRGYGNGHLVLTDVAVFAYKQDTYYHRQSQFTLRWNDPALGIKWPTKDPILSQRDAEAPYV